jgi:N-acylneuraminate cytidylyltransferase/CMP-N,N'-diacetyllegionaminic acid synthase
MKTLFLITARGQSKGVPKKNLRKLGGISLIGFKAISALRSKYCTRLIVSTDDSEIQEDAQSYGAEVPFTRPAELATDTASSLDVIRHAMAWIETETAERYDAIMLLEPSAPFARSVDFDRAIEMMMEHDASAVIGMRETEVSSRYIAPMEEDGRITQLIDQVESTKYVRRQDMRQEFTANGALYLFKWELFKKHGTMYADRERSYGLVMDRYHSVEIDEMIDLHWAEFLVEHEYIDLSFWR